MVEKAERDPYHYGLLQYHWGRKMLYFNDRLLKHFTPVELSHGDDIWYKTVIVRISSGWIFADMRFSVFGYLGHEIRVHEKISNRLEKLKDLKE